MSTHQPAASNGFAEPHATWAQVTYFQVYKLFAGMSPEELRVFANGRQQCRIVVSFTANDANGNPVTLSDAEISQHVRLIQYQGGQPIESTPGAMWVSTRVKNEYEWDENMLSGSADTHVDENRSHAHAVRDGQIQVQSVEFFLSTRSTSTTMIGAQITYPNGAPPARTNNTHIEFNKPDGDGAGQFHSAVQVRPVSIQSMQVEYGENGGSGLFPYPVGNSSYSYRAIEHRLTVRINGRTASLKSIKASSSGGDVPSIYQYGYLLDTWKWGVTYYAQPGARMPDRFAGPLAYVDITGRSGTGPASNGETNALGLASQAIESIDRIVMRALGHEPTGGTCRSGADGSTQEERVLMTPTQMFANCVGSIQNAGSTQAIVGLLVGNLAARFKTSTQFETPEVRFTEINIVDAYGNDHPLRLGFNGNKANELTLTRARSEPRVDEWMITSATMRVEHAQVYANGRQQARILITIQAKRNNVPVSLTASEKASLRLIRYDDQDTTFPWTSDEDHAGWAAQTDYRGYEFQVARDGDAGPVDPAAGDIFEVYVSAGAGEAGLRRMFGFSIEGDNGSLYRSTGHCLLADGTEQYLQHMDLGPQAVTASHPPIYPPSSFELSGRPPVLPIYNQPLSLSIFHLGRPIGIRKITCTPAGMIHW
ncbi:hypothetical protein [Luteibacter sp. CQ10]|uniref:hypothetical protein n=1 Tax=Luteibacter sp. CQ10 TaxID=2805821 RepID=UPI0034A368E0